MNGYVLEVFVNERSISAVPVLPFKYLNVGKLFGILYLPFNFIQKFRYVLVKASWFLLDGKNCIVLSYDIRLH